MFYENKEHIYALNEVCGRKKKIGILQTGLQESQ